MQGENNQQSAKFCVVSGHEMLFATLYCTFNTCNQKSRWVCATCLLKQLLQHGQHTETHIIDDKQLKSISIKDSGPSRLKHQINTFQPELSKLQQKLFETVNNTYVVELMNRGFQFTYHRQQCSDMIEKLISIIVKFKNSLQMIAQLMKQEMSDLNLAYQELQDQNFSYKLIQQFQVPQHLQDFINNQYQNPSRTKNQQQLAMIQQSWHQSQTKSTSIIINDKDFLLKESQNIQIYDHQYRLIKKEILTKHKISCVEYNYDNSILFFGTSNGFLYGYLARKNYSLIFRRKIHKGEIQHIFSIYDEVITICKQNHIIITNFRNNKVIRKYRKFKITIQKFNYDYLKGHLIIQHEVELGMAHRIGTQIFDGFNFKTILNQDVTKIKQKLNLINLQFLQPNFILYLSDKMFEKKQICYQRKDLVSLKQFSSDDSKIYQSFNTIDFREKFILLSNSKIYILDQEFFLIHLIIIRNDGFQDFNSCYTIKQFNANNKIIFFQNQKIWYLENQLEYDYMDQQGKGELIFPRKFIKIIN